MIKIQFIEGDDSPDSALSATLEMGKELFILESIGTDPDLLEVMAFIAKWTRMAGEAHMSLLVDEGVWTEYGF